MRCHTLNWKVDFVDPYQVIYVDKPHISTVDSLNEWAWFPLKSVPEDGFFGFWLDDFGPRELWIMAYNKRMVSEGRTRNLTILGGYEPIDSSRNLTLGGYQHPLGHVVRRDDYTAWLGKTGYVGFEYINNYYPCYGYFHIAVDSGGYAFTLLDYAYSTEPYGTIYTPDFDGDGDGYLASVDCDDDNAAVNPSQLEVAYNGFDDDCNTDTPDDDLDGDGFILAEDCDDNDANVNPAMPDIPDNGIDDDCDGDFATPVARFDFGNGKVYPNPATDFVHIDFPSATPVANVSIYSLQGVSILKAGNTDRIDLRDLPPGMYLLMVELKGNARVYSTKIVIL